MPKVIVELTVTDDHSVDVNALLTKYLDIGAATPQYTTTTKSAVGTFIGQSYVTLLSVRRVDEGMTNVALPSS